MNLDAMRAALTAVATPDDVLDVLELVSETCADGEQVCSHAWQEKAAGEPWSILQYFVDRAVADANRKLLKYGWGRKGFAASSGGEVRA